MKPRAKFGLAGQPYSFRFAVAAFAALACLAASPTSSMAQPPSTQAEKAVGVEITGPSSVMAGEPILLKWRLTNHLKRPVLFHQVGDPRRIWLRLELRDSDDRLIYREPEQPPASLSVGIGDILPEASAEGVIVATWRVLPPSPGRYTLRANVVLNPIEINGGKGPSKRPVVRAIDLPIAATPADEEGLSKMAFRLRERFLSAKGSEKDIELKALLSLKESAALPVWRSLADDPRLEQDGYGAGIFIRDLGELATPASVDLLVRMWGGDSESLRPGAKGTLMDLYRTTTDASLKAHIRKGFEAVGGPPTDLYDGPMIVIQTD